MRCCVFYKQIIIEREILERVIEYNFSLNKLPSNLSHSFCNLAMVRSAKSALCSAFYFYICLFLFYFFR
jgi:hypothetical protein